MDYEILLKKIDTQNLALKSTCIDIMNSVNKETCTLYGYSTERLPFLENEIKKRRDRIDVVCANHKNKPLRDEILNLYLEELEEELLYVDSSSIHTTMNFLREFYFDLLFSLNRINK